MGIGGEGYKFPIDENSSTIGGGVTVVIVVAVMGVVAVVVVVLVVVEEEVEVEVWKRRVWRSGRVEVWRCGGVGCVVGIINECGCCDVRVH